MLRRIGTYALLATTLLFSGCALNNQQATPAKTKVIAHSPLEEGKPMHDPYTFRLKPIIGTENNDARTIVDMGTVLKIWISPFKNTNGALVAAHNVYIWGKQPDFITGEQIPTAMRQNSGPTYRGSLPFSLSSTEIDRSDISNDQNIQKFIDELPADNLQKVESKKPQAPSGAFADEAILEFIQKIKKIEEEQ